MKGIILFFLLFNTSVLFAQEKGEYNNYKIDGYRPIWFDLGQKSEYGSKYSGGLGTYTVKHNPMAIYSPDVNKTFFVYGGTIDKEERYLLCMIGCYDHATGKVCKPTVVYDKQGVNDPHDNPALLIDKNGYLWVYVAGRGNHRPGFIYKSVKPYDISKFESTGFKDIMAYPQPRLVEGHGHFMFCTRYDGVRRLFYRTSPDGLEWSDYYPIASIIAEGESKSGHYQITGQYGNKLVTTFNRHIDGDCDTRTNMYYLQTEDFGKTWTLADGTPVKLPIVDKNSPSRVIDTESKGQNLYIKDVNFDENGNAIVLYLTSYGHLPGPKYGPREWFVAHWTGKEWVQHPITTSTHNYDSGSLYVDGKLWRVIAPTAPGPQRWGAGGEVESWISMDAGRTWEKEHIYTNNSPRNHSYMRRPLNAKEPFYVYWADGNSDCMSISNFYFADSKGNVYRLPYNMKEEWERPELVDFNSIITPVDIPNYANLFKPDYIKEVLNRVADWQLAHPKHKQNDWTNAAFYAGMYEAWQITQSKKFYDAMMTVGKDSTEWKPGKHWYHADHIAICQMYIDLYRNERLSKMLEETIKAVNFFMKNPYPTKGTVDIIKWWWCDALFMAPPVLVKLGMTIGDKSYLKYSDKCFRECYDLLYNKNEHLFARDLNYVAKGDNKEKREVNGKLIFWGRGNGWVMAGLARILQELPLDYPQRAFYETLFKEMSLRLISLQQADGLWRASLLDPESYPGGEVSGSGLICYALAWGINNGLLEKERYLISVKKAWIGLNRCVNQDGCVGWVQPMGADPRKNFSADSWEVYGTGAFLLAGSEIFRLKN